MFIKKITSVLLLAMLIQPISWAQKQNNQEIKSLVESYKKDVRGPYYRIKWFCKDGSIRDPKDPCPDDIGGGIQHASFKESALKLRTANHIFFGDILAAVEKEDFLDFHNNYSRLKQYQLGKYLASVDDGWILRKGQYYRGAIQSEDEQAWGRDFFEWLLKDDDFLERNFYLVRQALKDIPHNGDSNIAQKMRSESKTISEDYEPFMDIRIKIHGNPEASDIELVRSFLSKHRTKLTDELKKDLTSLLKTMEQYYAPIDFDDIEAQLENLDSTQTAKQEIITLLEKSKASDTTQNLIYNLSELLSTIRLRITDFENSKDRLALLDISNDIEHTLLTKVQDWKPKNLYHTLDKINTLICAANGSGLIENWEYQKIENQIADLLTEDSIKLNDLEAILGAGRSAVEWSAAMVKAQYHEDVEIYSEFEPKAYGFIDDRIRSSIALNLGETVSDLGNFVSKVSNSNNKVMNIGNQSAIRGLNPGYAKGELVVVDGNPDGIEVTTDKIYIFEKPPSDLKPVAGIMTVSEGNLVSHVQLLARNLGIPNAALSDANLKDLKKYSGQTVFYAVSNKGNVVLKPESDVTEVEANLFNTKQQEKNIITVPTSQIDLDKQSVVNMRDVDARDSGRLCGPKAANLGELKKLFPDKVVEGIIIPFGVFRKHMDQDMPNENKSYWKYLNDTFKRADEMKSDGSDSEEIENYQLRALSKLHEAIIDMPLETSFLKDLKSNFQSILGDKLGDVPVFLRSDTNMEDLKEFTGAGLNLTLFNIREEDEILKGIKRVWASAYTERSFKWRQRYLSNPENVFPSILIIPSVDVDYSGVMITKGVNSGNDDDLTVAFSKGAGGAVDGQSAETWLITKDSNVLLAPARQSDYIRLPKLGGTKKYSATFEAPILNNQNIEDIKGLAKEIRRKMDSKNGHAYDVEFGFKDNKLWLFQIRPFVENKQAKSSDYLSSIAPKVNRNKSIKLSTTL